MILAMNMIEKEIVKVKATVEMLRMCGESKRMISRMNQVKRLQVMLNLLEGEYYGNSIDSCGRSDYQGNG